MMTFARAAGASLLANLQSTAFLVRSYNKNRSLTETAV